MFEALPVERLDRPTIHSSASTKRSIQRIRSLETDLDVERRRRSALAYDQQALLAKMIRFETEIVLLKAERGQPE